MKGRKFIPLLVIAAGLFVYHNSFTGPFIFDDVSSVLENPTIRHLWPIWQALTPPLSGGTTVEGRPVVNLSLAVNYALGGTRVWGYHALNLVIHILAGLILLGVVRRTLLQPTLRERFGAAALPLALVAAVIWTVHPLQTASVTYIMQRAESLAGLFYLLTLYCFIRGTEPQRSGLWFTLAVVACLLGMASKEVMVSAPLMVLLYDRTFVTGSFRGAWQKRWRLYTGLAATWLLLGYLVAGTSNRGGTAGFAARILWWQYALTQCRAIMHYLRLSVWPHPLVFDYGTGLVKNAAEVVPFAVILVSLLVGTLIGLRRWPAIGFAGFWFFAILAPSSSVVPVATQTMAEHRMYLPLAAVIVLAATGTFMFGKHLPSARQKLGRVLGWGVGAAVILLFAVLTIQRNRDYSSEFAIWEDTVSKCPNNPRALLGSGDALRDTGRVGDAIGHYERALRIKPDFAQAHNSWGIALAQEGKLQEALGHFEQAVRIKPGLADAHYNLAKALFGLGKVQEAVDQWEQVVQLKPDDADAHNNLGIGLWQTGKVQDAVGQFEQVVRIKPDWAEAHCNLGNALLELGRVQEALGQYEEAVRLKPDFIEAQNSLARLRGVR